MTAVTIIGTGAMANSIGGVFATAGANVSYVSHGEIASAPIEGEIVVLAVPYPAVAEIISTRGEQLAGKTVVDITNPLNFETFDELVVPAASSAAAEIQKALPNSSVLKAFNTTFAATLASGTVGELTTTVLVAGDDDAAKSALVDLVVKGGLQGVDAGALSRARELEAIGFLQLTLAVGEKVAWTGGFGLVR
ncbi:NADPH-dependent F420 reductase [Brachybacterium saurashtrense]|uniref:Diguanylate cyclase n=1 Tax=Brachybacterium saurashtrense TaxID=556288 RepID=A0A345YR59_9MICO|nr:NADPH-dependent F420 reductase [Brachybacterium saurashtrense]AXK46411.1 diguanylate cyclase [Brachybacterium saurashtrense]RRR24152.1 diguanylate cyclase [Brachybacterium saurashtrense]